MLAKTVMTGLVGSLLLVSTAFAEPPTVSQSSLQGDWRASKIVGLSVYNDSNQDVGSISDLITDKSGNHPQCRWLSWHGLAPDRRAV